MYENVIIITTVNIITCKVCKTTLKYMNLYCVECEKLYE